MTRKLEVVEGGIVAYPEALAWQRALARDRIEGRLTHDLLLLVEHPPVVTCGRSSQATHLLRREGIAVFEVERGGDVTFHGPGQLVGYPIVDLSAHRQDLHWYLRALEQTLIDALATLGVPAERKPGYTGVWTRGGARKLASIGVHVKQWVTWHGFALNVTTDLSGFERIVPCGIPALVMTSVEREGGRGASGAPLWDDTIAAVVRAFAAVFDLAVEPGAFAPGAPVPR